MENERITDRAFLWDCEQKDSFLLELSGSKYPEFFKHWKELTPTLHLVIYAQEKLRSNFETEWLNNKQSVPKLRSYIFFNPATQSSKMESMIHVSHPLMKLKLLLKTTCQILMSDFILNLSRM